MIGVFVTFRFGDRFNERALREIAQTARAKFVDMPGLRSKIFTINAQSREAVNVYIWESQAAADAFFTEALLDRVSALYGVRPVIEFAPVAAVVDNGV